MTPERWQRVETLFQAALDRSPAERPAFLDHACGGDADLRREVEAMLAADAQAGAFLMASPLGEAKPWPTTPYGGPMAGRRVGAYRLLREIGQGGMGSVYLAERADAAFQKQVAVKFLRHGLGAEAARRRFHSERQILARLDHPHIARLLDGGTAEGGWPYIVMEYVEGQPIDAYCAERSRSVSERLRLFRSVCAAVGYAHQHLVVHRDLKPSNILVTPAGEPKLLDFGIAKLLDPGPADLIVDTATAARPMTPQYASPEQARGEPVTTASDVYSLGVLLYELLTGSRPYQVQGHTPQQVERIICDTEPPKPSAAAPRLGRWLTGDLDNIVGMALRKEPARRYTSVQEFSEDIRRHMENQPVVATSDTFRYRLRKFLRRHRAGVAAATLILITLLGGVTATLWQAREARRQRARAEQRLVETRQFAQALMFDFHNDLMRVPGTTPIRRRLVQKALEHLNHLAKDAGDDPTLQLDLAAAYHRLGMAQSHSTAASLGDTRGALESHRKAQALRAARVAAHPADEAARRDLAGSLVRIGELLHLTGDLAGALDAVRQAIAIREAIVAAHPADARACNALAWDYVHRYGPLLEEVGDQPGALRAYQRSLALCEQGLSVAPTDLDLRYQWAAAARLIGDMQAQAGQAAEAMASYDRALEAVESALGTDPTHLTLRSYLVAELSRTGRSLARAGEAGRSLEIQRRALALFEAMPGGGARFPQNRRFMAMCYLFMGETLAATGDLAGALRYYRQSAALREALAEDDPLNLPNRRDLGGAYAAVGATLVKVGDLAGALRNYRQAVALREALLEADALDGFSRHSLARDCAHVARVHTLLAARRGNTSGPRRAHWKEALAWYRRGQDVFLDLRQRGILKPAESGAPEEVAAEMARCENALQR